MTHLIKRQLLCIAEIKSFTRPRLKVTLKEKNTLLEINLHIVFSSEHMSKHSISDKRFSNTSRDHKEQEFSGSGDVMRIDFEN